MQCFFPAKNQPPNRQFCMEKSASRIFMTWLKPKVAEIAKGTSRKVDIYLMLLRPLQSLKPTNIIETVLLLLLLLFVSFEYLEFSLPEGRSARRNKIRKRLSNSWKIFHESKTPTFFVFKLVTSYYTAVSLYFVYTHSNIKGSMQHNPLPDGFCCCCCCCCCCWPYQLPILIPLKLFLDLHRDLVFPWGLRNSESYVMILAALTVEPIPTHWLRVRRQLTFK